MTIDRDALAAAMFRCTRAGGDLADETLVAAADGYIAGHLTLAAELWVLAHPDEAERIYDDGGHYSTALNPFLPLAERAITAVVRPQ